MLCSRFSALMLLALGSATIAAALPITYSVTSTVSGAVGAQTFSNVLVTVTTTGDTNDIVPRVFDVGGGNTANAFFDPNVTTRVTIPGLGTATVTMPTGVLAFPEATASVNGFPTTAYVLIARLDEAFAGDITGITVTGSDSLLGYGLNSSIGPIPGVGGIGYPAGDPLSTSLGNLSFTSNIVSTETGTFTATVVPEPSSLFLFSGSLVGLFGTLRSKRLR
jgi:hypothetical protein